MKAIVLAAGEGRRLRPLTEKRPKPMLPAANAPILEHVIDALVAADVEEIVLVVGYKRERIQSHFGDGSRFDVDITYVVQEPRLGTGDALLQAEQYLGSPFLVLNGNQIVEPSLLKRLVEAVTESGETTISVTRAEEPERYGVVTLEGDHVETFVEKPPAHAVDSELVSVGAYGFTPDVFAALREIGPGSEVPGELQLTDVIRHFLDRPIRAVRYDGPWLQVIRPWDLLTTNADLLQRDGSELDETVRIDSQASITDPVALGADVTLQPGARVLPGTAVGPNVTVGPNAVVRNSVVLPDATIGPGCVVRNAIVGAGTTLRSNVTIEDGVSDIMIDGTVHPNVRFGGLVGDGCVVGANSTIRPGTIVGNDVVIDSAAVIDGIVDSGTHVRRG
jgi:glucose-1-phosphate thymidylyltransferase